MISKELLSEVLGVEGRVQIIHHMIPNQTMVYYDEHISCASFQREINIYELAYRCKEWADKEGHQLVSGKHFCLVDIFQGNQTDSLFFDKWISADTEPEAVFKATQWILDNKELLK